MSIEQLKDTATAMVALVKGISKRDESDQVSSKPDEATQPEKLTFWELCKPGLAKVVVSLVWLAGILTLAAAWNKLDVSFPVLEHVKSIVEVIS